MSTGYSLMNPLCKILDKDSCDFIRSDFLKIIIEKQIERITFHYIGLDGKLKELKLPISNKLQAERILAEGERVDGSSLFKGMVDTTLSDLYVVPLYKSAFLNPFDSGSLDFMCRYLNSKGERAPFAPDNMLYQANKLFKDNTSIDLYALGELEFFLLSDPQINLYPSQKQRGYHAAAPFIKSGEILNEMVRYITQLTGAVKYAHSEVGFVESVRSNIEELKGKRAEQLEIEFLPTLVEDAADNLILGRWIIRNVAYRHGCVATFTPKIEEGIAGNGLHIHIELVKNGKNIMVNKDGNLSKEARQMIGGLCKYADSLTAFGNTVSSAYLRLVPNQEAPTRICWSDLNRSAMIRVPLGWSKISNLSTLLNTQQKEAFDDPEGRQTVELRSPDGSAFVHLLIAGMTLAAEWGLTHSESLEISERLYTTGNIFEDEKLVKKLPSLPGSCVESAEILLKNRNLYERENIFPQSVINYMSTLLHKENDSGMNAYLIDLPADDRLYETRKIMHKDIHRH
ncbi:MAG: glutamine synthetase [Calditrichaeota bacterium]|nr:glutamine synthetase [Calditrichota bacterium]RQV92529.1 MAG: glutamine synthetase [bacterium]